MNIRRKIPPSLRSLLTDIGPKEEWTDTEPDAMTRDGIKLPTKGAASGQEAYLSPAETREKEIALHSRKTQRSAACMFCKCSPSCYTCPRCNLHYCSLACYRSPDHSLCSEGFYKEAVLQELKAIGTTESEGRKKMQEVLMRLKRTADETDGGMESLLKEAGIVSNDTDEEKGEATGKVQVLDYLSKLAELQQSGEGSTTEMEAILRKLEEIGGGESVSGERDQDGEGAEEELDVTDWLSGLDIDKLSEDELWDLLNGEEKELFKGMMKGGTLGGLVPLWKPWWEDHDEGGRALVEVLEEEVEGGNSTTTEGLDVSRVKTSQEAVQCQSESASNLKEVKGRKINEIIKGKGFSAVSSVPQISAKIPTLNSLCAETSPLVCYGLINALYAYAFTLCYLNNDTASLMFEFCDIILALSESLNSNRVFNSVQEALDCGETLILRGGYLDGEDRLAPARALEAVAHIMTGRGRKDAVGYCLAALSQLRSVLSRARKALSKEAGEGERRQKFFLASKKCEFFQAWTLDNGHRICTLAIELWHEKSKRERLRSDMQKAKTVVGENIIKEKNKGKLIQELC
ncbi:zinc finger HIT domain-containing protein 2 [Brachionichthys hirsutus]|uniref:zinc finger HIT domain-containing protein 2 n=1 Tax=Brachionichthys hirsutus TaxID=412623 RepID=UPI003604944C